MTKLFSEKNYMYKDEKPPIQWKELHAWCKREETIWIHQYHYI